MYVQHTFTLYNQRIKALSISQLTKTQDKNSKKKEDIKHNQVLANFQDCNLRIPDDLEQYSRN